MGDSDLEWYWILYYCCLGCIPVGTLITWLICRRRLDKIHEKEQEGKEGEEFSGTTQTVICFGDEYNEEELEEDLWRSLALMILSGVGILPPDLTRDLAGIPICA